MSEPKKITITIPIPFTGKKSFLRRTLILAGISLFFLLLFYGFSIPVKEDKLVHFDFNTTVRLQNKITTKVDPFFSALSVLGNFESTSIILFVFLFIITTVKISKSISKKGTINKLLYFIMHPMLGFVVFFVFGAMHAVEIVGKLFLDHPGPPHMFLRTTTMNFPQLYVQTRGSYPSGHSMRMIFILIVMIYSIFSFRKLPQAGKLLFFVGIILYTAFMLLSRVVLGEHWTTDVIAGSLLGSSAGFFALIFL